MAESDTAAAAERALAGALAAFDVTAQPQQYVACALCGTGPTTTVATRDRYGLPVRVVRCVRCGLQFQNPRMTEQGYAAFYRHGYRPLVAYATGREIPMAELEADQWGYAAQLANTVAPWMPEGARLLDVGGSTGIVGRLFRARWGGDVTVIDPAPDELARARDCWTVCVSAEHAEFPVSDVALLCRTIDHLLDPLGVLRRLREAASLLVVDAMDVGQWPERARYKVDHPYAFTAATFHKIVTAAGWQIRQVWQRQQGRYTGLVASPQE